MSNPDQSFEKYDFLKTQILSKVSFCIFHDANHYKNIQNDKKTSELEPFEHQFHLMMIFWISGGHFPILWHNENTVIEHGLIYLYIDGVI